MLDAYIRTVIKEPEQAHGLQIQVGGLKSGNGGIYESYGRAWIAKPSDELEQSFTKNDVWTEMVIDAQGGTKTDSRAVLQELIKGTAALAPLGGIGEDTGGYKGYGYCTVVEILSAALQGGGFMKALLGFADGRKVPYHLGHFFMAVDIEAFCPLAEFKKTAGEICRQLRASKKMPGAERIYTAGEKEHLAWLERKDKGVPVDDIVVLLMADYGVHLYGNTIVVNPKFAAEKPEAVRAFMRKGCRITFSALDNRSISPCSRKTFIRKPTLPRFMP